MIPLITTVPQKVAKDLDRAWLNFDPDLPLPSDKDGSPHPFYIERGDDPLGKLQRALLRSQEPSYKYYVSGHRGCGKSTELLRLVSDPEIKQKYLPIFFSIRDEADIADVDYRDVLLIIGTQMFMQFKALEGYSLQPGLWESLNSWAGTIEKEITTIEQGQTSQEVDVKVSALFASISGAIKLEPKVREKIRQAIEPNITGLLNVLKDIAIGIQSATGKIPLVLIDDLDKLDLAKAKELFHDRHQLMRQPLLPIIYTVSSSLFYTPQVMTFRDKQLFVPNIKLHEQGDINEQSTEGVRVMNRILDARIDRESELISADARGVLLKMSGGVFRELAHLVQSAADHALGRGSTQIELEDAEYAAAELRSGYWRILTADDRKLLEKVRATNKMENPDQLAPLLQILAVLEYRNGEEWCDVHPVLNYLLDRLAESKPDDR